MKNILTLLLAVFITQPASAGEEDTTHTPPPPVRYNAVKLGGTVISIFIPLAQVSYEQRRAKLAWQATIGFGLPQRFNVDDSIKGTAMAYSLRLGGRFYPSSQLKPVNAYLGGELFYTWFKRPHSGEFYYPIDQSLIVRHYYDEYLMKKHTFGAVVQGGLMARLTDRFFIDISAGLGLKLMYTSQQGRTDKYTSISSRNFNVHAIESRLEYELSVATPAQLSVVYLLR